MNFPSCSTFFGVKYPSRGRVLLLTSKKIQQKRARKKALIPPLKLTDDGPVAASDGHDFPGLIDEGIPGVAAVTDNVVEGFEDSVRQPVLSHALPDVFLGVELWRTRRQGRSDRLPGIFRSLAPCQPA